MRTGFHNPPGESTGAPITAGVLGRAIVFGYETLYATYADAHNRPNTDLAHVFSTKTNAGKQAIDKMIATFKNLAKEADFDRVTPSAIGPSADTSAEPAESENGQATGEGTRVMTRTLSNGGVTINVNVALTLPETTDERVFEAFFRAMRKHLIDHD